MSKLVLALLIVAGCSQTRQPPPPPPANPTPATVTLGRCFAAGGVGCQSNSGCLPPFVTCQEGSCCSGELDPKTCICQCAGGAPCRSGEWCCKGDRNHVPPVKNLGVLMCRPKTECIDNAP